MVDVPVEHQNPLDPQLSDRVCGRDRHVVEQAEPHRPVALGVMTWRPQPAEGPATIGQQPLRCADCAPGGVERRLPRARAGDRVEIDLATASLGDRLD